MEVIDSTITMFSMKVIDLRSAYRNNLRMINSHTCLRNCVKALTFIIENIIVSFTIYDILSLMSQVARGVSWDASECLGRTHSYI